MKIVTKKESLELLATAIVTQAAEDYRDYKRRKRPTFEVESFFKSQWGDTLSFGNASYIHRKLKEETATA